MRVLGTDLARSPDTYRRIGIAHDRDALWPFLTARAMVALCARLRGVGDPDRAAAEALQRGRPRPTWRTGSCAASPTACASA